ncbi:tetratricopeptide repeat protein [Edaphobacter sp. HDX4]|uniref:tetratricopeptide repeat protein n=1 Tax=Edaphobacter sp. HDX4 TaxID=2794064 RepID=UPI002FE52FF7
MVYSSDLRLFGRKQARAAASFLALTISLLSVPFAHSYETLQPAVAAARIERDRHMIDQAQQQHLTNAQIGRLWAEIASDQQDLGQFGKAQEAYNHALRRFEPEPSLQADYAVTLNNLGTLYAMTQRFEDSLNCRRRALSILQKAGSPLLLARGEAHLADAYLVLGRNKEARQHSQIAIRALEKIPEASPGDKASALVGYSFASCLTGHCAAGLDAARQAMTQAREMYAADSFALGQIRVALGYAEWQTGNRDAAEGDLDEAVRVLRLTLPAGHPLLLQALEIYRTYLSETNQREQMRRIAEEEIKSMQHPRDACAACSVSIYGLHSQ